MARKPNVDETAVQRARDLVATSTDQEEVRAAQAYLLPHFGLSLDQAAQVVGRDRFWVSRARNRFIKGEAPPKHGGRRTGLLLPEEEMALLKQAFIAAVDSMGERRTPREELRDALAKIFPGGVSETTLTAMLSRLLDRYVPGEDVQHLQVFSWPLGLLFKGEERVADYRKRMAQKSTDES
jgi:hypothetical protein